MYLAKRSIPSTLLQRTSDMTILLIVYNAVYRNHMQSTLAICNGLDRTTGAVKGSLTRAGNGGWWEGRMERGVILHSYLSCLPWRIRIPPYFKTIYIHTDGVNKQFRIDFFDNCREQAVTRGDALLTRRKRKFFRDRGSLNVDSSGPAWRWIPLHLAKIPRNTPKRGVARCGNG